DERPFIDNRTNAYSDEFLNRYRSMDKDSVWQEMEKRYGFNIIYFYRHDNGPWIKPFLAKRLIDPQWVPVYQDVFTLILVKKGGQNQAVIDRYGMKKKIWRKVR